VNEQDFTPSLAAGIVRYKVGVLVTLLVFALLGAVYSFVAWAPEATMTVVVQVASGVSIQNAGDADRATSEVAAQLSSPEVIAAAEAASGVTIDKVSATSTQGQSTIAVSLAAGSASDATAGAAALVPAYRTVSRAQDQAQVQVQLDTIDASLKDLQQQIDGIDATLAATAPGSAQAALLQTQRATLVDRKNQLQSDRDKVVVSVATPSITVAVASGPHNGSGRLSLMVRYVPAALVFGLVVAVAGIAVLARRRPWLANAPTAARVLRAPLLAAGDRSGGHPLSSDEISPVAAVSILRHLGDAVPAVALIVPRGGDEVDEASKLLARRMAPVFERSGVSLSLLSVTPSGRVFPLGLGLDTLEPELEQLWSQFTSREVFEEGLDRSEVSTDVVVIVPARDIDHELLLDLLMLADVAVVAAATGDDLDLLISLRRDFDALGREPTGVLVDLPAS
jgi:hypothetical protein